VECSNILKYPLAVLGNQHMACWGGGFPCHKDANSNSTMTEVIYFFLLAFVFTLPSVINLTIFNHGIGGCSQGNTKIEKAQVTTKRCVLTFFHL